MIKDIRGTSAPTTSGECWDRNRRKNKRRLERYTSSDENQRAIVTFQKMFIKKLNKEL